jgi:hypothetical protein
MVAATDEKATWPPKGTTMAKTSKQKKTSNVTARSRSAKAGSPLKSVTAPPRVRRRMKRAHGLLKGSTVVKNPSDAEQRGVLLRKARQRR